MGSPSVWRLFGPLVAGCRIKSSLKCVCLFVRAVRGVNAPRQARCRAIIVPPCLFHSHPHVRTLTLTRSLPASPCVPASPCRRPGTQRQRTLCPAGSGSSGKGPGGLRRRPCRPYWLSRPARCVGGRDGGAAADPAGKETVTAADPAGKDPAVAPAETAGKDPGPAAERATGFAGGRAVRTCLFSGGRPSRLP